jgi:glycosyltransferase involved in cell wall biosynthesis
VRIIPPGVKPYEGPSGDLREELGISPDDRVIGVIGRLKPDRGYDVILKAFSILRSRVDKVKLVIVGRSSQIEDSVMKPLKDLGIERDVIIAGYRFDDYFLMIQTFDIYIMMRAGSDGSGRALREVLELGRPAIVSNKGMLPDLVDDGKTGFITSWDASDLASKMEILVSDAGLRRQFGENARKRADTQWDFRVQAKEMKDFYEALLRTNRRI